MAHVIIFSFFHFFISQQNIHETILVRLLHQPVPQQAVRPSCRHLCRVFDRRHGHQRGEILFLLLFYFPNFISMWKLSSFLLMHFLLDFFPVRPSPEPTSNPTKRWVNYDEKWYYSCMFYIFWFLFYLFFLPYARIRPSPSPTTQHSERPSTSTTNAPTIAASSSPSSLPSAQPSSR